MRSKTKLISEASKDLEVLLEGEDGEQRCYIEGVFARANAVNKNKRIYPKDVLEEAVDRFIREKVNRGVAFGTLDHGHGAEMKLADISHRIIHLEWDGDELIGRAEVLPEGAGRILSAILKSGGKIGMSTRGMGDVELDDDGHKVVKEGFSLLSVDAVLDPSVGTLSKALFEATDEAASGATFMDGLKEGIYRHRLSMVQAFMKSLKKDRLGRSGSAAHVNTKPVADDSDLDSTSKAADGREPSDTAKPTTEPAEDLFKRPTAGSRGSVVASPYLTAIKRKETF